MKRSFATLLLISLMLAGCGTKPGAPAVPAPQAPEPPAPEPPAPFGLLAVSNPTVLTMDQLSDMLARDLNEAGVPPAERLRAIFEGWYSGGKPNIVEVDLDGDHAAEIITAMRMGGNGRPLTGAGALFIIYKDGSQWAVDRSPGDEIVGVDLHEATDLTGDGTPEIIWGATNAGAHTVHHSVFVSQWQPDALKTLPGDMKMTYMQLTVDGKDLVLHGGMIGSAGAGPQRARTDRYRWSGGEMRLVDRAYAPDPLGYWRLIDGIVHEQFGRVDQAEQAYRDAMDPAREVAPADMIKPEQAATFPEAVRTMARMRLAWLLIRRSPPVDAGPVIEGASGPFAGLVEAFSLSSSVQGSCPMAADWARSHPDFVDALNGVFGYANEIWSPTVLCGNLPV